MHEYCIDRHPKVKILFWIALVAIAVTPVVVKWLNIATSWANIGTVSFSSAALFYVFYLAVDRWLLRIPWGRRLLLVPDLNGTWDCAGLTLRQGDDKPNRAWTATIQIAQSWSRIVVHLKTATSDSRSTSAAVVHEEANGYRLRFSYWNTPKVGNEELRPHAGFCEILFNPELVAGEGEYFTNHQRLTFGSMKLTKKGS